MTSFTRLLTLACLPVLAFGLIGLAPDEPDMEAVMKGLKNNLQAINKSLADPANDAATLASLHEMEVLTLSGKLATPPRAEVPEAKWDQHVTAYRADMARLLIALAQMEVDVLEGRHEKAAADVRGVLIALRNESHDKYQ